MHNTTKGGSVTAFMMTPAIVRKIIVICNGSKQNKNIRETQTMLTSLVVMMIKKGCGNVGNKDGENVDK